MNLLNSTKVHVYMMKILEINYKSKMLFFISTRKIWSLIYITSRSTYSKLYKFVLFAI